MIKKILYLLFFVSLIIFSSCTNDLPNNPKLVITGLSSEEIRALDIEYSTKALTQGYISAKLNSELTGPNASGVKLTKELLYAMIKNSNLIKQTVSATPGMFNSIASIAEVIARRASDPAFDSFITSLDPNYSVPVNGSELRINTFTTGDQQNIKSAIASNGNYIAVWQSNNQVSGSSLNDIYAQRYKADGSIDGSEFRVNTTTSGEQMNPAVGMDGSGNFVVVWQSNNQDGGGYGIYAQRYNNLGQTIGSEFKVNNITTGDQTFPAIDMNVSGAFIISWQSFSTSWDIYAQPYNNTAAPIGSQILVAGSGNSEISPSVSIDNNGNFVIGFVITNTGAVMVNRYNASGTFLNVINLGVSTYAANAPPVSIAHNKSAGNLVVAWNTSDGNGSSISAQRFDASGNAQDVIFQVNTFTNGDQKNPSVKVDNSSNFVITWASSLQDGSNSGIYAQRYDELGVKESGEFIVNTTTINDQTLPYMSMNGNGNFIIGWTSNGQDGSGLGVYTQRFNTFSRAADPSATQITGETKINSFTLLNQQNVKSAVDSTGNSVIVWQSQLLDGSLNGIFAQRYDSSGNPVGSQFRVNTTTTDEQMNPAVGMDGSGNFVVVWQSNTQDGGGYGIYAQRYNNLGQTIGSEFKVNTTTAGDQTFPAIDMNVSGAFIISWQSMGVTWDIYAQPYNNTAAPIGSQILVAGSGNSEISPSVSIDNNGNFVIGFVITNTGAVMVNRYNSSGTFLNAINLGASSYTANFPSISIAHNKSAGNFVVAWNMNDTNGSGISAQRFDASGNAQDVIFQVNTFTNGDQKNPSVKVDNSSNFVITWASSLQDGSNSGIYAQGYDELGVKESGEFIVNTTTINDQTLPYMSMNGNGNFIVGWTSNGQDGSGLGVYTQRFNTFSRAADPSATQITGETKINSFTLLNQQNVKSAVDSTGNSVIVWQSQLLDGSLNGIFAQRYDSSGNPVGSQFRVNTTTTDEQMNPAVGMDGSGNFVVVWQSNTQDGGGYGIYAQRYNNLGQTIGSEFKVNTTTAGDQTFPAIDMNVSGAFIISWQSMGVTWDIYAQPYNNTAAPIGSQILVAGSGNSEISPSVSIDNNGNFVIGFVITSTGAVMVNRYNSSGTFLNAINLGASSYTANFPSISIAHNKSAGNFVVAWNMNDTNGSGISAQRFDASGNAQEAVFPVNTVINNEQKNPSVKVDNSSNFVITWASIGQDGSNSGIYARRYNSSKVAQGAEFLVNTITVNDQTLPFMSMSPDGNFMINWTSNGQDGSVLGVYTKRFSNTGSVL